MTDTTDIITNLNEVAGERSRYRVIVSVKALDGTAVTPTSLKWALTDNSGKVINNRTQQVVVNPTSATPILLFGQDLAMTGLIKLEKRKLIIEATYTEGGILGLPYNHEYVFQVMHFAALPKIEGLEMFDSLEMQNNLEMKQ